MPSRVYFFIRALQVILSLALLVFMLCSCSKSWKAAQQEKRTQKLVKKVSQDSAAVEIIYDRIVKSKPFRDSIVYKPGKVVFVHDTVWVETDATGTVRWKHTTKIIRDTIERFDRSEIRAAQDQINEQAATMAAQHTRIEELMDSVAEERKLTDKAKRALTLLKSVIFGLILAGIAAFVGIQIGKGRISGILGRILPVK